MSIAHHSAVTTRAGGPTGAAGVPALDGEASPAAAGAAAVRCPEPRPCAGFRIGAGAAPVRV